MCGNIYDYLIKIHIQIKLQHDCFTIKFQLNRFVYVKVI